VLARLKQERFQEEFLRWRMSSDESKKRALGMLTGSQASLVIKEAFAGWRELLLLLRQKRIRPARHDGLLRCGGIGSCRGSGR
jgi:hypothetical protein